MVRQFKENDTKNPLSGIFLLGLLDAGTET